MSLFRRSVAAYKGWPKWGRIAAPVTAAFIGIGALGGGAQESEAQKGQVEADGSTTSTEPPATTTEAPATTTTVASSTTVTTAASITPSTAKPVTTTTVKPVTTSTVKPVTTSTVKPVTTTTAPPTTTPPTTTPPTTSPPASEVYYANCDAARAAGVAPIYADQPGYRPGLDRDKDGIACDA